MSPGLTYYANFRKTLTRGTRVIDTHPLAAGGEPVSEFLLSALGLTLPAGRFEERIGASEGEEEKREKSSKDVRSSFVAIVSWLGTILRRSVCNIKL